MQSVRSFFETSRLMVRRVQLDDIPNYHKLYGSELVMANFSDGKTRSAARVDIMILLNLQRWAQNNPFSCMTITRKENGDFIGIIFVSTVDRLDGTGLLGYLLLPEYWQQGYASEAVAGLLTQYIPAVNQGQYAERISAIYSYAKPGNIASMKILEKVGFQQQQLVEKFGGQRFEYVLQLNANASTS